MWGVLKWRLTLTSALLSLSSQPPRSSLEQWSRLGVAGSVRAGTTEGEGQREASPFCTEDVDVSKDSS